MFSLKYDIHFDDYMFTCPSCNCVTIYRTKYPTSKYCRICDTKVYPRIDIIIKSIVYRTIYHFSKEDLYDNGTKR